MTVAEWYSCDRRGFYKEGGTPGLFKQDPATKCALDDDRSRLVRALRWPTIGRLARPALVASERNAVHGASAFSRMHRDAQEGVPGRIDWPAGAPVK